MHLTVVKETNRNRAGAENMLHCQKLIVSTALNRFTPFQYVLVAMSSQHRAVCQVVKKPDLHENYCYLNASVFSCKREAKSRQGLRTRSNESGGHASSNRRTGLDDSSDSETRKEKKSNDQTGKDEILAHKTEIEETHRSNYPTKKDNNCSYLEIREAVCLEAQEDSKEISRNTEDDRDESTKEFRDKVESKYTKDDNNVAGDGHKNDPDLSDFSSDENLNDTPNVFEEFTGNKVDVDSIVELSEEVEHCNRLSVTVVMDEFYQGTSEEFSRFVKQILTMYTFTSHCFINVHLENIHSIIIHDATPSPQAKSTRSGRHGSTLSLSKPDSLNPQTSSAQNIRTSSFENSQKCSSKATPKEKVTLNAESIAPENFDLGFSLNASLQTRNNPSQSAQEDSPSCARTGASESAAPTNAILTQTTPSDVPAKSNSPTTKTRNPTIEAPNTESSLSISTPSVSLQSIPDRTKLNIHSTPEKDVPTSEPLQMNIESHQLVFVSPKTKLTISNVYSAEYYKQLVHFHTGCECVDEYVHCSDTWRHMKQLIECRKRGMEANADGKQLNSANKILLTGVSGSGKSFLVRTLARYLAVPLVTVAGTEFGSPSPGVAESSLRDKFTHARALAEENKGVCIVLFEQIQNLVPSSPSLSHTIRLSLTLTRHLDSQPPASPLVFIFTSTSAHSIGAQLKTHARVYLTAPTSELRRAILRSELAPISILNESIRERSMMLDSTRKKLAVAAMAESTCERSIQEKPVSVEVSILGGCERSTPTVDSIRKKAMPDETIRERLLKKVMAVTGSHLPVDLIRVAGVVMLYVAKNRQFTTEGLVSHVLTFLSHYRPSCLKAGGLGVIDLPAGPGGECCESLEEGRSETGQGGYAQGQGVVELGGLSEVRAQIEKKVEWPLKYAAAFERLGIPRSKGILLYGPPGCAKTSLVRSLARTSACRVLAVSAAQLYSPYVGEAEANVAALFHRARTAAPAILFIDEIDSLVGNRSEAGTKDVQQSVLSVFLNEMDGVGVKPEIGSAGGVGGGVMVIAATNRPASLDAALVRPGRLDTLIYVRPPDETARREILGLVSARGRMSADVDLSYLAAHTRLYSGADLSCLYTEAALISLLDKGFDNAEINQAHWLQALSVTRPSLTPEQLLYYEEFERSV